MKIAVPRESHVNEMRVPLIPESVAKLTALGGEVLVESGLGHSCRFTDDHYHRAGAKIVKNRRDLFGLAQMVLRLRRPPEADITLLRPGVIHISYLDPFHERGLVAQLAKAHASTLSMEMIPRTTRAQKMDALSSQASLSGYGAVVLAAKRLEKIFPMMMTPAGTLAPAKVFVIGAGVAGLQAIATAKRLGARVEAFDTRPVTGEQVQSLGAKFVKVNLGEEAGGMEGTGQTQDGYARQLTSEQLEKQRQVMAKHCASADVVITTAQVFGKKAPLIITEDMVRGMRPGALIVDLAVETGGNVANSRPDEEVDVGEGVCLLAPSNLPGAFPVHASQMYSSNITHLVAEFWDKEAQCFRLDRDDEIIRGCLITHGGVIVHERFQ